MTDLIKTLRGMNEYWQHAPLYNEAANEIERLRAVVDAASMAWFKSGAFDNYECYFGATLGKCPQSNDCWECQLHQALTALEIDDE